MQNHKLVLKTCKLRVCEPSLPLRIRPSGHMHLCSWHSSFGRKVLIFTYFFVTMISSYSRTGNYVKMITNTSGFQSTVTCGSRSSEGSLWSIPCLLWQSRLTPLTEQPGVYALRLCQQTVPSVETRRAPRRQRSQVSLGDPFCHLNKLRTESTPNPPGRKAEGLSPLAESSSWPPALTFTARKWDLQVSPSGS